MSGRSAGPEPPSREQETRRKRRRIRSHGPRAGPRGNNRKRPIKQLRPLRSATIAINGATQRFAPDIGTEQQARLPGRASGFPHLNLF